MVPQPTTGPRPTNGSDVQKDAKAFNFPSPPKYDTLEEEREGRKQRLALAFRIFGQLGFDEGVAGHLTYRDPILKDHFWVNPFGINFRAMQTSDLLLIAPDGSIKMGGKPDLQYYNQAAFAIHHAIHTARPDVDAACHSHSIYGKTFSTLGRNIEFTTQDSCALYGKVGLYENFGGVVLSDDEGHHIADTLGKDKACVILQNHGILSSGQTIEGAVMRFITLERHCQVMLMADAAAGGRGTKPIQIEEQEAEFTHQQTGNETAAWFQATPYFKQAERESKGDHLL